MTKASKFRTRTAAIALVAPLALAGIAVPAITATGAIPSNASLRTVHADQFGIESAGFPVNEWFIAATGNPNSGIVAGGLDLTITPNTRILHHIASNDIEGVVADGLQVTSTSGAVSLQLAVTGDGGPTILSPAATATPNVPQEARLVDQWTSSKPVGAANQSTGTLQQLADALAGAGDYSVDAVGFATAGSTAVIRELQTERVLWRFAPALAASFPTTRTTRIQKDEIGAEGASYPSALWFVGNNGVEETGVRVSGSNIVLEPDTQLLRQFTEQTRPSSLEAFIGAGITWTVPASSQGTASFQIPVTFGDGQATTLTSSTAVKGRNVVSYRSLWTHTGAIPGIGETATLAETVSALYRAGATPQVRGYGVRADGRTSVASIQWSGNSTVFADDEGLSFTSIALTGSVRVLSTLQVKPGLNYAGASYSYQWYRNDLPVAGATSGSYRLSTSDYRKRMSVKVTARKAGYLSATKVSGRTATVAAGRLTYTKNPTISGVLVVGHTLAASAATSPTATFSYEWIRDGSTIAGATSRTYRLTRSDQGHAIAVRTRATRPAFVSQNKRSAETAVIAAQP